MGFTFRLIHRLMGLYPVLSIISLLAIAILPVSVPFSLAVAEDFYWKDARLEPDKTDFPINETEVIKYYISVYNVQPNDWFIWEWYYPVKNPNTGLPTGEKQQYIHSGAWWYKDGEEWWNYFEPYYLVKYRWWKNYFGIVDLLYVTGNEASFYPGEWEVRIIRRNPDATEPYEEVLTSTTFTLIDDVPPQVGFLSPTEGALVEGRVEIKINAVDNAKVSRVELLAENQTTGQSFPLGLLKEGSGGYYSYIWSARNYPLGTYRFKATAYDVYGNVGQGSITVMSYPIIGDVEMSAVGDKDLPGVTDPFFIANFDPEGNIIVLKNEPIGELVNDSFDLNIALNAYPGKPPWSPLTDWKWQIQGYSGGPESGSFSGWQGTIPISTAARSISERTFGDKSLKLSFLFKDDKGRRVNPQNIEVTLKILAQLDILSSDNQPEAEETILFADGMTGTGVTAVLTPLQAGLPIDFALKEGSIGGSIDPLSLDTDKESKAATVLTSATSTGITTVEAKFLDNIAQDEAVVYMYKQSVPGNGYFDFNTIISDYKFTLTPFYLNSAGKIQDWLRTQGSGLADVQYDGQPVSEIIYNACQTNNINVEIVLATLQKEQGLIRTEDPTQDQLNWAMGYRSPSNIKDQIEQGTAFLRNNYDSAPLMPYVYPIGANQDQSINYYADDSHSGMSVRVKMNNRATYSLYRYTNWIRTSERGGGNYLFYRVWTQYGFGN